MPILLAQLRERTASAHAELEQALDLTSAHLDLPRYVRLVVAFERFLGPWERGLFAALGEEAYPTFAGRHHADRARADVEVLAQELGDARFATCLAGLPMVCDELPALTSAASAWGSAYVIEGSTLGGKFIAQAIAAQLGFTADAGASYFAGYGPKNGPMWIAFRDALTAHVRPPDHPTAVHAATVTFAALHRWMDRCRLTARTDPHA